MSSKSKPESSRGGMRLLLRIASKAAAPCCSLSRAMYTLGLSNEICLFGLDDKNMMFAMSL